MAYFLDNYPVPASGSNLVLTEEEEKNCRIVYRLDDKGGMYLFEPWDPKTKYSDDYAILPIKSTGAKTVNLDKGQIFANVINSGGDKKIGEKSWIELWKGLANDDNEPEGCYTDTVFYRSDGTILKDIYFWGRKIYVNCPGGVIVGGHVLLNATEAAQPLDNALVYIIPICTTHNIAADKQGAHWGTGFYMKLRTNIVALELIGYKSNIKKYIEEFKDEVRHE